MSKALKGDVSKTEVFLRGAKNRFHELYSINKTLLRQCFVVFIKIFKEIFKTNLNRADQ